MPTYRAFAGLRNDVSAERLEPSDLVVADNVDIDASGQLSRRAGRTLALAGAYHSLWSSDTLCLMVGDTQLLSVAPDYSVTVLRDGLARDARVSFCAVNERVYWSNGYQSGIVEAGRNRSWGIVPPASPGTAAAIAGELTAGTYQWAVTFLRGDGQESGCGLAGRIELADGAGIALSELPRSDDPEVVAKILYLSEPNGSVLYEALTLDARASGAVVLSPTDAAVPLATQLLQPPPPGHLVAYYRGRLFVADGETLYYSEPHAYEWFDLRRHFQFAAPITLLAPVEDAEKGGIVVSDGLTTGWLGGTDPDAFELTPLSPHGAVLGSLVYVPGTLFDDGRLGDRALPLWLSTTGLCAALPDGTLLNLTEERYQMTESGVAGAVFMSDQSRYLVVTQR